MASIAPLLAYPAPQYGRPPRSDSGPAPVTTPRSEPGTRVKSDAELCRMISSTIGKTQTGTVDIYDGMLRKYMAFYKDVTEFRARLRTYISAGTDHNHIGVDIGKINYELQALRQKWRDEVVFGPAPFKQARQWSDEWDLPLITGGYAIARVVIDTTPLDAMIEATGKVAKTYNYYKSVVPDDALQKVNWLAAEHHAWDTAMGEQHRQIETKVNTLAEQYNHTLSTFNNLTKMMSASINAMFESLGNYVRGL